MAFLDEPTAGVDPEGRLTIRAVVAGLKEQGVCVVLTTHELTEAETLADRIVILADGRVARQGTPGELAAAAAGPPAIVVRCPARPRHLGPGGRGRVRAPRCPNPNPAATGSRDPPPAGPAATAAVATWLAGRGVTLTDLATGRTLEDVYFEVVGAAAREPAGRGGEPAPARGRRRRRGAR